MIGPTCFEEAKALLQKAIAPFHHYFLFSVLKLVLFSMEYLPLTTKVNCSNPGWTSDVARVSYACSKSSQLESTIIHLVYITAMMLMTAIIYVIYRQYHNSRAERRLLFSAVLAADAVSKSAISSCLNSAKTVHPAMLAAAKSQ